VSLPLICDMTHDLFSGVKMSAIFRFMDSSHTNQFCHVASKICRTFFSSNQEQFLKQRIKRIVKLLHVMFLVLV
jgi:hypothetical protein